jgi:dihydrofolate reductase
MQSMQGMQSMQSNTTQYNLIVAMSKNKGIGYQGFLPWPFIKEDMQYFSKMTRNSATDNNCIIMGKNTWESLPGKRPLPKRDNLVLSSTLELNECMPDEHITKSFKTLDDLDTFCKEQKYDTCWVIGGATIYKQFMERNKIEKCYITYIDMDYECDVFFDFPEKEWSLVNEIISDNSISAKNGLCLKFQTFIPSNSY